MSGAVQMKVIISALGESYGREQERAMTSFLRARAAITLEYWPRLCRVAHSLPLYPTLQRGFELAERSQARALLWHVITAPVSLVPAAPRVHL
eukprot:3311915-Rhodomonas_salina.1